MRDPVVHVSRTIEGAHPASKMFVLAILYEVNVTLGAHVGLSSNNMVAYNDMVCAGVQCHTRKRDACYRCYQGWLAATESNLRRVYHADVLDYLSLQEGERQKF